MSKSIVAIGDIHGCLGSLQALWKKLEPYKEAQHIFVGDYIDRGPASRQVVDFLLKAEKKKGVYFFAWKP